MPLRVLGFLIAAFGVAPSAIAAADPCRVADDNPHFVLVIGDDPNVGMNDPTAALPVGNNTCATVGGQRIFVFNRVLEELAAAFAPVVPIVVQARFTALPCSAFSATLGQANAFRHVLQQSTGSVIPIALANQLNGADLLVGDPDIQTVYNAGIGEPGCFERRAWDYGATNITRPGYIDFAKVLLHEIGHGLAFASSLRADGSLNFAPTNYDRFLYSAAHNARLTDLNDAQRAAAIVSANLWWAGPIVRAAAGQIPLAEGLDGAGRVRIYAPNPFSAGSSLSHFAQVLTPDVVMEPQNSPGNPETKLFFAMMQELGYAMVEPSCGDGFRNGDEECDSGPCCTEDCHYAPGQCGTPCAPGTCDAGRCLVRTATVGTDCTTGTQTACYLGSTCDGAGACLDRLAAAQTPCGGRECEPAFCDGAGTCQGRPHALGTPCGDSRSTDCDAPDACDGLGVCRRNLQSAGTLCRASIGVCDIAEICDGLSPLCPADIHVEDDTQCADRLVCNGAETCQDGTCTAGVPLDCGPKEACLAITCNEPGGCDVQVVPDCCATASDCDDGDRCTDDLCPAPGGDCVHTRRDHCCEDDLDCTPDAPCTRAECVGNVCQESFVPGCCASDDDCPEVQCAENSCDLVAQACRTTAIADCCTRDVDCPAPDLCTTSACDPGGICSYEAVEGCCLDALDCPESDACTARTCVDHECVYETVENCCTTTEDCTAADLCSVATCDVETNTCQQVPVDNCCVEDLDCPELDACTPQICITGECRSDPIPDCCSLDSDCDDLDGCTVDACLSGRCDHEPIEPCGETMDAGLGDAGPSDAATIDAGTTDAATADAAQTNAAIQDVGTSTPAIDSGIGRSDAGQRRIYDAMPAETEALSIRARGCHCAADDRSPGTTRGGSLTIAVLLFSVIRRRQGRHPR